MYRFFLLLLPFASQAQTPERQYFNQGVEATVVGLYQKYIGTDSIAYTVEIQVKNKGTDSLVFPLTLRQTDNSVNEETRVLAFTNRQIDLELNDLYFAMHAAPPTDPDKHNRHTVRVHLFPGDSLLLKVEAGIKPHMKTEGVVSFYFENPARRQFIDQNTFSVPSIAFCLELLPASFSRKIKAYVLQPFWHRPRKAKNGL